MPDDVVIRVENLGKRYQLGLVHHDLLAEKISAGFDWAVSGLRRVFSRSDPPSANPQSAMLTPHSALRTPQSEDHIWALRDVSLEVKRGEVLGIIGRNGAGKSTLLKVLTGVTDPTEGEAWLKGRIGSLLEVGTGFHPELTGRENIFLNGAILGMSKAEINAKLDEIIDFAGDQVEKFIDTPVKRYSSGMYVRLAFAVAAHLEPEILLVDEVLAVGDAAFQKKCLGKMHDVGREGRTVLFVSHNMLAIANICPRAIWLEDGAIREDGPSATVVSGYLETSSAVVTDQVWEDMSSAPGNDRVRLHRASVSSVDGATDQTFTIKTPLRFDFDYWNLQPATALHPSVVVYNEEGVPIFNTGPINEPRWQGRPFPVGLFRSTCYVPGDLLNDGQHRVWLYLVEDGGAVLHRYEDILVFEVREEGIQRRHWFGKWLGAVRPALQWETQLLQNGRPPNTSYGQ